MLVFMHYYAKRGIILEYAGCNLEFLREIGSIYARIGLDETGELP